MEWFYRLNGKETGPISANDLKQLYTAKTITAKTRVRRGDMPDWQPLRHFVKAAAPKPAAEASAVVAGDGEPCASEVPASIVPDQQSASPCSECGRAYAVEDLIRFDDYRICADCKPRLIQKLRKGVRAQGDLAYAGFWVRLGAKFIDALILFVVNLAIGLLFVRTFGRWGMPDVSQSGWFFLQAVFNIIGVLYTTFFLGRFGATPGKMAYGLKVVSPHGGAIGYPRALGRQLAEYLSGMILMFGYMMAAFDGERRALHDRICHTRVVRR